MTRQTSRFLVFFCACQAAFSLASPAFAGPSPKSKYQASQFEIARPGWKYAFPRDHGSHPPFATEWWYYTGHLHAKDGREFGFQATWFRVAIAPAIQRQSKWATRDLMFAHFALTDTKGQKFYFTDKIGRANLGLNGADVNSKTPRVWVGDWNLQFGGLKGNSQSIALNGTSDQSDTRGQSYALKLNLKALKNPIVHGSRGISIKSAGASNASHYYSFTRLQAKGEVTLGGEKLAVSGQSWFDHEFGSSQLARNQVGWDWFSLQMSDGRELMLYRLRLQNGGVEPFSSGTLIEKDGRAIPLKLADFRLTPQTRWTSPNTKASYPISWKIEIPRYKIALNLSAAFNDQELSPLRSGTDLSYWEGLVKASGQANGRPISAQGYLEMTGYAKAFDGTF